MKKFCCCDLQDPPTITLNVNCPSSCCESRLDHAQADITDLNVEENKDEDKDEVKDDNKEDTTCCCCFTVKRHAKVKKGKERSENG